MKIEINDYIQASWYKLKMKNIKLEGEQKIETFVNPGYFVEESYDIEYFFIDETDKYRKNLYNESLKNNLIQDFLHFIISVAEYSPSSCNYGSSDQKFKIAFDVLIKCKFIEIQDERNEIQS